MKESIKQEKVVVFGVEYVAFEPGDSGMRIGVEIYPVKWRLETALIKLGKGDVDGAVESISDAMRELYVAESTYKVPCLVRCLEMMGETGGES